MHDLCVLCIFVKFTQPLNLLGSLLGRCLLHAYFPVVMEFLGLLGRVNLNLVERSQDFVTDGAPSIVFVPAVPSVSITVIFWLVKFDIDAGFAFILLQLHVIAGRKRIYVYNTAMTKNLVVNQRRELCATQAEPDVAASSHVK